MYSPNFIITPELNNLIAKIEVIRQKVQSSHILPQQEIALRYKAAIESVHSSTSIEGNPLSEHQVEKALAGQLNKWEHSVIEVNNYKKAWDWVVQKSQQKQDISLKDIFAIHSLVADQLLPAAKTGKIRPGEVYIVDIIGKKEVVKYVGPKNSQVKKLLDDLLIWLKKNKEILHPVLLAGIFHYEFVSIHPFSDGNGRATRLLVKLLLDSLEYDFRGSLVLDKYYWQNQAQYYAALNQARDYKDQRVADLGKWLSYFVTGFYEVAQDLEKQVNLASIAKGNTTDFRLSNDEFQILDFVQQFQQITLADVLDMLRVPERTGQRRLKNLVDDGLLVKVEQGKNTFYTFKLAKKRRR